MRYGFNKSDKWKFNRNLSEKYRYIYNEYREIYGGKRLIGEEYRNIYAG